MKGGLVSSNGGQSCFAANKGVRTRRIDSVRSMEHADPRNARDTADLAEGGVQAEGMYAQSAVDADRGP